MRVAPVLNWYPEYQYFKFNILLLPLYCTFCYTNVTLLLCGSHILVFPIMAYFPIYYEFMG